MLERMSWQLYPCWLCCDGCNILFRTPGRPVIEVSIEKIEYLRNLRFTWTKISEILGVSRSTLYRRLDEEGVNLTCRYSNIDDHELDRTVESIKLTHPNDGERLLIGHLRRLNIILPRSRVRASIHRVDPINTAIRRSLAIRRRVYYVSGPNSLWHIDGHHKLIKYRFVSTVLLCMEESMAIQELLFTYTVVLTTQHLL